MVSFSMLTCWYFILLGLQIEAYSFQSGTWNFRKHPIAYEKAESSTSRPSGASDQAAASPILLLNGFGVGSFHQHRLIDEIYNPQGTVNTPLSTGQNLYCIDYLGQGRSWPESCQDGEGPNEKGLRYCGQTWMDQISSFIEEVILPGEESRKVHIVGNSVGGHLATFLAANRPDLVDSLVLLNATPVWGLNLPGWSGELPAPVFPKAIGRFLFDQIRDLETIEKYLEAAYYNRDAFDQPLMSAIRDCTENDGGHAAFASILWSPPITTNDDGKFYDALSKVECDVLLLFGADDPWCKPAFARRMMEMLPSQIASRYVQLDKVGHCPNHEAPVATANVLQSWLLQSREERRAKLPLFTQSEIPERWGATTVQELGEDEIDLSLVDRLAVTFV